MVYFSVVKCPCPRDHPLIKCISVVFDSKDIGDLKAMTTNIFFENMHFCLFNKKDEVPKWNTTRAHEANPYKIIDRRLMLTQLQSGLRNNC